MKADVVNRGGERIYNIHFYNITDLYDYLKSNPPINKSVFVRPVSNKDKDFYGEPLPQAIEYLLGGYEKEFDNFLSVSKDLKAIGTLDENTYQVVRSLYGGVPVAALVAAGVHDCMLSSRPDVEARAVNIHFSLSYPALTDDKKITNRGLATLFIVQALEEKGYIINFDAFQVSKEKDEVIYITINLKQSTDSFLNIQKCYYPMYAKEFYRRILFRVLESSDVTNKSWGENYGRSLPEDKLREFLISQTRSTLTDDLVIADPISMGITGDNIYQDTFTMIKKLDIEEEFDMESLKRKIR